MVHPVSIRPFVFESIASERCNYRELTVDVIHLHVVCDSLILNPPNGEKIGCCCYFCDIWNIIDATTT